MIDVPLRPVRLFGFALGAALLAALASSAGLLLLLTREGGPVRPAEDPRPVAPRLQVSPERELERQRSEEKALLESYGWVDREEGILRIPIERAIERVAERERSR